MIKKFGVLLLVVLYTITASGFALNLHYCGTRVASVKINTPAKSCGMAMGISEKKCCKDIKVDVKVKDAHEVQSGLFLAKVFNLISSKPTFQEYSFSAQQVLTERFFDRGPPDISVKGIPVFLKNCIFRI